MIQRMKVVNVAALMSLCLATLAHADALSVSGRIVDESGAPIPGATVTVRGQPQETNNRGAFEFEFDSPTTLAIRATAPGYYGFVHTLHRSDFVAGRDAVIPPIELVRKKIDRVLLMFAGDTMLARRYFEPREGEPVLVRHDSVLADGKKLLAAVRPYVELADYASVNLETQLSNEPLTDPVPKSVTFYSPVELAELLQWAGFDYVALGNNHTYDYREAGLDSTFAALEKTELAWSGGGYNEADAREPARADFNNRPFSWLSYVGWAGTFEPTQTAEDAKGGAALGNTATMGADLAAQEEGAVSVLQLHAGLEYAERPAMSERTTLRQAVDDGADIVIGHHAHVLQGFEIVDERLIAYSMGNFLFDQYHYTTQLGMLLFVWMDGETLHRAEVVPLNINGYLPTPATGLFRHAVLTRIARLSYDGVCLRPSGFHAAVTACDSSDAGAGAIVVPETAGEAPLHVRSLGASPLLPVAVDAGDRSYRLGIDLSRRGDFEYARLFGAHDRTWILDENTVLKTGDDNRLEIRVPRGAAVTRTGMKVFERVFTLSNPATVSGRLKANGDVRIRFLLQRRRMTEALDDELKNGPITEIGTWQGTAEGWTRFAIDYRQPRIATRSVRFLIDVEDISDDQSGASVSLDDLAWVEWQTPWIAYDDENVAPEFATHVQFRAQPIPR